MTNGNYCRSPHTVQERPSPDDEAASRLAAITWCLVGMCLPLVAALVGLLTGLFVGYFS